MSKINKCRPRAATPLSGKSQSVLSSKGISDMSNMSLINVIKNVMNDKKIKRFVRLSSDIVRDAAPFVEQPTTINFVKSAFSICSLIVNDAEVWADDYFMSDDWVAPFSSDFNQTILNVISGRPYQVFKASDDSNTIRIVDLDGIKLGYVHYTRTNSCDRVYVETVHAEKAKKKLQALLWENYGFDNLVLKQKKPTRPNENDSFIVFEKDDNFSPMPSERSTTYSAYLNKHIQAGVARSVMLYGPPGTGKSTMARTLVDLLHMRSFRIRVEDVANLDSSTLYEAISVFSPDAVILDDFDRSRDQVALLETLEFFQKHIKLVIATVNDRNQLDEAILRPGRFDELLLIKQMDADVVRMVLGPDLEDAFDVVKDWPIAFIQEYVKRRKIMTKEEAIESTQELALRVKRLEKYDDQDDITRMYELAQIQKKQVKKNKKQTSPLNDLGDDNKTFHINANNIWPDIFPKGSGALVKIDAPKDKSKEEIMKAVRRGLKKIKKQKANKNWPAIARSLKKKRKHNIVRK